MSPYKILNSNDEEIQTCCLCCSLSEGAQAAANFTVAIKGVQLITAAVLLGKAHAEETDVDALYNADIKLGLLLCDAVLLILFSIMLWFGVGKITADYEQQIKKNWLFYPWTIYVMIQLGLTLGASILFLISKSYLAASGAIVVFLLYSYLFFSVLRYFKQVFIIETMVHLMDYISSAAAEVESESDLESDPAIPSEVVDVTLLLPVDDIEHGNNAKIQI